MSYHELKRFSVGKQFKQNLLSEMTTLLPDHSVSRLTETVQCISNAVSRKAKSHLSKTSKEPDNLNTAKPLLSETVVLDLDNTMQPDTEITQTQISGSHVSDENDSDAEDDSQQNLSICKTTECLDDSITKLKQVINSENKPSPSTGQDTDELKSLKKNNNKCCNSCKVKSGQKKKYDMIQCSACMNWYHEMCVGISKNDPIGLWFCLACRTIPQTLTTGINSLKADVDNLKQSTQSILSAVKSLSTSLESSVGNLNDRLTALQRQINAKDLCITEELENLSNTTNSIKTSYDQKSCQILNKTTAVFEKVKEQSDKIKTISESTKYTKQPDIERNEPKQQSESTRQKNIPNKLNHKRPHLNNKQGVTKKLTSNGETKAERFRKPKSLKQLSIDSETIDLTHDTKKSIKESTLLVGSSIFKTIKNKDLKSNATVRSFPGATTETLKTKLQQYDLDNCKTIILHVGGNDADNGVDLDDFQDNYIDLLDYLASGDRLLIVSGLLPRGTVDLEPYNKKLKLLCDENDIKFIDHYHSFLLASGELPETYFCTDKIHLNHGGIRKLLQNIEKQCKVMGPTVSSRATSPIHRRRSMPVAGTGYHFSSRYCHICSMRNHNTQDCWFNARHSGISHRSVH